MTYEEYVHRLSGSKMTDKALKELFEREDCRDKMLHKLLEENCALKEKLRWHYPGKGELPGDRTEKLVFFKYNDDVSPRKTFGFYNGRFWETWRGDASNNDVIAWMQIDLPEEV